MQDLQIYPPSEDIYQYKEEKDLNPEDITKRKHQTKRKELGTKRTLNQNGLI
jgi:hypothetical protein